MQYDPLLAVPAVPYYQKRYMKENLRWLSKADLEFLSKRSKAFRNDELDKLPDEDWWRLVVPVLDRRGLYPDVEVPPTELTSDFMNYSRLAQLSGRISQLNAHDVSTVMRKLGLPSSHKEIELELTQGMRPVEIFFLQSFANAAETWKERYRTRGIKRDQKTSQDVHKSHQRSVQRIDPAEHANAEHVLRIQSMQTPGSSAKPYALALTAADRRAKKRAREDDALAAKAAKEEEEYWTKVSNDDYEKELGMDDKDYWGGF